MRLPMLTLGKAARACGVPKSTVSRAIKSGRLYAIRGYAGQYSINPVDLFNVYPPKQVHEPDVSVSSVRNTQIGGAHYHEMKIQPYEYSLANNLGPLEHTAIKYVSRWKCKNGVEDLKKAIHTLQFLIEYTEKNGMPK